MESNDNEKIAFKRYIACLLMLLVLGASNQVLTMLSDAQAVNKADLQRMLSQRIAKLYLAMYWAIPYKNLETELNQAMDNYEQG